MHGLGSWNQFLKISDYLKTCSPVSLEHRVPHCPPWTAFRACWGSTAAAAQDSVSAEAGGKCSWQTPTCSWHNPLRYSCQENPIERGAWWATVHGMAKSQTPLHNKARARAHTHTPYSQKSTYNFCLRPHNQTLLILHCWPKTLLFFPPLWLLFVCLVLSCVRSSLCHIGFSSCCMGLVTMACGIWVPWPGIEPMSPALEGGYFITGPQQKSPEAFLLNSWLTYFVCYVYYIFYNKVN